MSSIESKVAQTILQQPVEIRVGDKIFSVAPASTATLIIASEETAKLPHIKLDGDNILIGALGVARDCHALGDIAATLILGAKGLKSTKRWLFGSVKRVIDHKAILAKELLEDMSPSELKDLIVQLLNRLEISDFFGLTTSLLEINLLRQTRGVERKTTTSGQ